MSPGGSLVAALTDGQLINLLLMNALVVTLHPMDDQEIFAMC